MKNEMLEQLRDMHNSKTKEQIKKDWDALSEYDNVGPTVDDFISFTEQCVTKNKPVSYPYSLDSISTCITGYTIMMYVIKCIRHSGGSEQDVLYYARLANSEDYAYLYDVSKKTLNNLNTKHAEQSTNHDTGCKIQSISGSPFHDAEIMDACIAWCEFVGYDSKDEKIFNAFIMGAKLALSNNGWCNCNRKEH